jgi:ABC-type phosphate transport system substrate-binding protein
MAMKNVTIALLLLTAMLVAGAASGATVIVNNEVDPGAIDAETLERIYLGKKTLWDSGQRITPALVNETSDVSKNFLEQILNKSVPQYRAYWKKRLFSGGGTVPKTFRNSAEVIDFVAKTPGAIGVVETGPKDGSVRVIEVAR